MPTLIEQPTVIHAAGNKPKRIEEYAGQRLEGEPLRPAADDNSAAIVGQLDGLIGHGGIVAGTFRVPRLRNMECACYFCATRHAVIGE